MGMFDMMGKVNEMKKAVEEVKSRLDSVYVEGTAGENTIKVIMNGNRIVQDVKVDDRYLNNERKAELEELLTLAVNRASEKAQNTSESELKAAGAGILPNIPGLF
jgi:DNA-binding YbaB/EbfC family protein